jgi:hypothetical protein
MKFQYCIILLLLVASCGNSDCPPVQDNTILSENAPESAVYQAEIQRLVSENAGEVHFYFDRRETVGEKTFLTLDCFSKNFCGKLFLLVEQEDALSSRLQNRSGYSGAKLSGLEVAPIEVEGEKTLVYRSMKKIID